MNSLTPAQLDGVVMRFAQLKVGQKERKTVLSNGTKWMRSLSVLMAAALLCMTCTSASPPKHAEETVTLRGDVYSEKYFGPPNYGEHPKTDEQDIAYILHLDHPLNFVTAMGSDLTIEEVQLINFDSAIIGKSKILEGQLDQAVSGHHRREIILVRTHH
jgi:hypothetical protein